MISASSQPSQGGLAFATPGDWFAVRLPRDIADTRRLAAEVTAARPELAPERPRLEGMLASLVDACTALDMLCAYATVLDVPAARYPPASWSACRSWARKLWTGSHCRWPPTAVP